MQIRRLAGSGLMLKGKQALVVIDPPREELERLAADVVILSKGSGSPEGRRRKVSERIKFTVEGPGEYEVGGVNVLAFAVNGADTLYLIEIDGLSLCHLGTLKSKLPNKVLEEMGDVDVLIIPLDGGKFLSIKEAVEVVNQLEPQVIVPLVKKDSSLEKFAAEFGGVDEVATSEALKITCSSLPQETEIVNLTV